MGLAIYGPRGDPQIPVLPSRSFAAAVVAWLGVGLVWFLKCESRNARRAKSVGQLDLGYAVRSRALPWAGSCLACFGRLYNNVGSAQALWPFEPFAAADVGLMLGWFLKCESRNARRAKYVCLAWTWVL